MNVKHWKYILFLLTLIFILGELVGRFYGLCNHPIFIKSANYEYVYAPNQDLKIYNNHFITNEYSMRSKSIDLENDTSIVLLIGDSVINGGASTDHKNLASSILEERLSKYFHKNIRVLNISCGSWGPDNAAAYIKEHGTFNADLMVLVVNSNDARDHMTFEKKVGTDKYPDKRPLLAWTRITSLLSKKRKKKTPPNKHLKNTHLNTGFEYFQKLSQEKKIPLFLYLHASKREIEKTKPLNDKLAILQFCSSNGLKIIDESQLDFNLSYLRDHIHYNDKGQKFLANILFSAIKEYSL